MAVKHFRLNVLVSVATTLLIIIPTYNCQIIIPTTSGLVSGKTITTNSVNVVAYLGIPYARPPINQLRFKPPVPVSPWNGVLNATQYQYSCPQRMPLFLLDPKSRSGQINEDCLYLNIFTTTPSKAGNMSVLVDIHGGAFYSGTGARGYGQMFAAHEGVVVVTINYRLGVLGFMSSGESDINQRAIQANLGLQDQSLALKWIYDNIENFGGNPDLVTIAGNSAGGLSVAYHLVMPTSKGLFRGAIMQSAPFGVIPSYLQAALTLPPTLPLAGFAFQRFSAAANCSSNTSSEITTCLQALPLDRIMKVQNALQQLLPILTSPVPDGSTISEPLYTAIPAGRFHKVPVITGTTLNDGYFFLTFINDVANGISRQRYLSLVHDVFRTASQRIKLSIEYQYTNWSNINSPLSNRDQYGELATYYVFAVPNQYFTDQFSRYVPTYTYVFAHRTNDTWEPHFVKISHAMEIPYVLGIPLDKPPIYPTSFTTQEVELSRDIMSYWGNFVRNG